MNWLRPGEYIPASIRQTSIKKLDAIGLGVVSSFHGIVFTIAYAFKTTAASIKIDPRFFAWIFSYYRLIGTVFLNGTGSAVYTLFRFYNRPLHFFTSNISLASYKVITLFNSIAQVA
jgi:hypothetical protein